MTPTGLRDCLALLHWSQRGLADLLGCNDRLVRTWAAGQGTVPPQGAEWLEGLARDTGSMPPPESWKRRAA